MCKCDHPSCYTCNPGFIGVADVVVVTEKVPENKVSKKIVQ